MKMRLAIAMLWACFMAVIACHGRRGDVYRTLFFEQPDGTDTASFHHARLPDQPFSVELLGRSHSLSEKHYVLFLQIGVYGSPGFAEDTLTLNPDKVLAAANGLESTASYSILGRGQPPYEASSVHFFSFDRDSLAELLGESCLLRFEFHLDEYAVCSSHPVEILPIVAYDPWFSRLVVGKPHHE